MARSSFEVVVWYTLGHCFQRFPISLFSKSAIVSTFCFCPPPFRFMSLQAGSRASYTRHCSASLQTSAFWRNSLENNSALPGSVYRRRLPSSTYLSQFVVMRPHRKLPGAGINHHITGTEMLYFEVYKKLNKVSSLHQLPNPHRRPGSILFE